MRRVRAIAFLAVLLSLAPSSAAADHKYYGHHPASPPTAGFCYVDGLHNHPYAPAAQVAPLFRTQGGVYYFVGDPYHFGYTRPAYPYDGHHPIHAVFGGGWCFVDGPHYHFFHPHRDEVRAYTVFGSRYYYIGPLSPDYPQLRDQYYIPPPPIIGVAAYAPYYATWSQYALSYGLPASVTYVVGGRLPKRAFVPGMYAGAYFGLPGFHAGVSVGVPGVSAHFGVSAPAVGFGVGVGVVPPPPGVVVVPGGPPHVPPGWYRGKKKGWKKPKKWDRW